MSRIIGPAKGPYRAAWRKGLAALAVLVAYPGLIHWAVFSNSQSMLGELLIAVPLLIVLAWFLGRSRGRRVGLIALAVGTAAGGFVWHEVHADPAILYPIPHLSANLFMLWVFGRTLRPGREALITRVARYVHGTLPDEVAAYTRRVTWAWSVFFAGMVIVSASLFVLAPLTVWSLFANVLNLPLLVIMFFGEYAWRALRHPHFARASFPAVVQAFRKLGESTPNPARGR